MNSRRGRYGTRLPNLRRLSRLLEITHCSNERKRPKSIGLSHQRQRFLLVALVFFGARTRRARTFALRVAVSLGVSSAEHLAWVRELEQAADTKGAPRWRRCARPRWATWRSTPPT